jgi:hypothetical protein
MSRNKSAKKCKASGKTEQNRAAMENDQSSLPSGKDESRLVTVVREQWDAYQAQEKRFSKEFALALIALHEQLAKPGYGSFVEKLKELKIPTSTAYRLMRVHGWQPDKRSNEDKPALKNIPDLDKGKAVVAAIHYLDQFHAGKEFRTKFAEFWRELRNELWDKIQPAGAKKPAGSACDPEPEQEQKAM